MASSSTIKEAYNESVAVQGGSCHPQLNNAFLKTNTPGIAMTYAETCFLLAEAKVRGSFLLDLAYSGFQLLPSFLPSSKLM